MTVAELPQPGTNSVVVPVEAKNTPGDGASGSLNGALRIQQIYDATQFSTGPITIRELRFRPYLGATPFNTTISNLQIRLSTSQADPLQLNATFSDNSGGDETVVYEGALDISSSVTPGAGGANAFDIRIPLQVPFRYNPDAGNLLIDIKNVSGAAIGNVADATGNVGDLASRAYNYDPEAEVAEYVNTGADIIQVIYDCAIELARYSIEDSFSSQQNPNGAWSYGYLAAFDGQFKLLPTYGTSAGDNGVTVESWSLAGHLPGVFHNPSETNVTSNGGAESHPPGAVWYTAGEDGTSNNYGAIRFTVPENAAGTYRIESEVHTYLDGPISGDTDYHVTKNGSELFGQLLDGSSGTAYTNVLSLSGGDTLDFLVGRGADGSLYASGLSIKAVILRLTEEEPLRTFRIADITGNQEGSRVSLPLTLDSSGDVGGMTLVMTYDTNYLAEPSMEWSDVFQGWFSSVSYAPTGEIHAAFALPATALPGGTQQLATIRFLLRSVPSDVDTTVHLRVVDTSDASGDTIRGGTAAIDGTVEILTRTILGDNNANSRLDVGDASIILRYLTQPGLLRPWDITGNDLNHSQALDTGDAIKALRAAAGIDPQPSPTTLALSATRLMPSANSISSGVGAFELAIVQPSRLSGASGDTVTLRVLLPSLDARISGAAFTLDYPIEALRLRDAQSYRTGQLVPSNALAVWNVAPNQNDFDTQSGKISLAVSSADAWTATNGVLAEFDFEVQAPAENQYLWPIALTGAEVTYGFGNAQLVANGNPIFVGREPVAGWLSGSGLQADGGFQLLLNGDPGAEYVIEASSDLVSWEAITNVINVDGVISFVDEGASNYQQRFYRTRPVE